MQQKRPSCCRVIAGSILPRSVAHALGPLAPGCVEPVFLIHRCRHRPDELPAPVLGDCAVPKSPCPGQGEPVWAFLAGDSDYPYGGGPSLPLITSAIPRLSYDEFGGAAASMMQVAPDAAPAERRRWPLGPGPS
jgi:hypothetical protein